MPSGWSKADIEFRIQSRSVLVVDDNQFMRKIVRNLLMNIRVREVYEAGDGIAGLDAIRTLGPDIVVLDWELPLLNGAEFVRIVRSPACSRCRTFQSSMLSAHGERWRVLKAARLGVNEYLRKPVSAQHLLECLISILAKPRPIVQVGEYYGPEPRRELPDSLHDALPALPDGRPVY